MDRSRPVTCEPEFEVRWIAFVARSMDDVGDGVARDATRTTTLCAARNIRRLLTRLSHTK